jgi:fucose permease
LFFFFVYCALEDTLTWFFTAFAFQHLGWSKTSGAQATFLYWACFALCRFSGIFVAKCVHRARLAAVSLVFLVLSYLALVVFSWYGVNVGVWVSIALIGAAMAPIFAATFMWMDAELVRTTGPVTGATMIAMSAGAMVNPIILGFLMTEVSPMCYTYLLFGEACLCLLTFLILRAFSHFYLRQHLETGRRSGMDQEVTVPSLGESKTDESSVCAPLGSSGAM